MQWLAGIELADASLEAFWVPRGYAKVAEARTTSRIDTPARGPRVRAGAVVVAGMAWAPHCGVERVELAVDATDVSFINDMTPHHSGAITRAQLAVTRAGSTQVKDLAGTHRGGPRPRSSSGWA